MRYTPQTTDIWDDKAILLDKSFLSGIFFEIIFPTSSDIMATGPIASAIDDPNIT